MLLQGKEKIFDNNQPLELSKGLNTPTVWNLCPSQALEHTFAFSNGRPSSSSR
jgi:hypothetical protein